MTMNRRHFMATAGAGLAALNLPRSGFAAGRLRPSGAAGIGICDWNLGPMCDPGQIPRAVEAHLEGIQVSVGRDIDTIALRDPEIRRQYVQQALVYDIVYHSVAAGGLLNSYPLATEPYAAVWVIDAIEAAAALGARNILMAFFGNGDLRRRDEAGELINQPEGGFSSYALKEDWVESVVQTLKHIVPRARDAGVVLGLENTITARQNLAIIEAVGSEWVQIYYDVGNSWGNGYDVPGELRLIGNDRLCEVHLKDWNTPMLGSEGCMVDMAACARALDDIGYDKWLVLETSGRRDRFIEDTRANVEFVKNTFTMA